MSLVTVGLIGFVILFALLALGLPIGVGMGVVGVGGMWYVVSGNAAYAKLAIPPFETVANYELAVVPLFLLMAHVVFTSGMGKDLYSLAAKWLGHKPGGVAMASVAGCAGFAAVSASSMATAATMGLVALPEMKRLKYDQALATGCVAAGGSIGILIPPSALLIIYGILTESSIGKLFIAGIVPGVLEAVFYIVTIYMLCTIKPSLGPRGERYPFKEKIAAFGNCGEIIALIIIVLTGITIGWFTPTEAGAVGAFGAIVFSLLRRRLTWAKLQEAFFAAMKTTGMIYGILIGAFILNYFLAITRIPFIVSEYVAALPLRPLGVLGFVMLLYLGLGCILDGAAMMILTIPIFFPLAMELGFDPIWFGILICRAMEIAMITPPIGINVYVISGIAPDVPMHIIFRGILPFLIADILHVLLIIFVPSVAMFLPNLLT
ncbi:MAG: TRAP transporter large permease [Deltaproteobacteria bacterium]|nr:MAG: TRAP transporter large permease [Deltaproteobacteria bacterium]